MERFFHSCEAHHFRGTSRSLGLAFGSCAAEKLNVKFRKAKVFSSKSHKVTESRTSRSSDEVSSARAVAVAGAPATATDDETCMSAR